MPCAAPRRQFRALALAAFVLFSESAAPTTSTAQVLLRADLAPAQVDTADAATRAHWERAEQFLTQQQWDEAVQAMRRSLEGENSRFEPLPDGHPGDEPAFSTFVPVRQLAQLRVIGWKQRAPEAFALYRKLNGALAGDWLVQGKANRDPVVLRRIVDQAFASGATEEALRLLGEIAISRGKLQTARSYFEQLHPALTTTAAAAKELSIPAGISWWHVLRKQSLDRLWPRFKPWLSGETAETSIRLAIPNPQAPLVDAWARLVIVSILEGSLERARLELEILRRLNPQAEGQLAGRKGTWIALLERMLDESADWQQAGPSPAWPTFAGNAMRNELASAPQHPISLGLRPVWSYPLPKLKSEKELIAVGRERIAEEAQSLLSYHPVVVDNTVLLRSDAVGKSFITALNLRSGELQWRVDYSRGTGPEPANRSEEPQAGTEVSDAHAGLARHLGVARYTGHVAQGQAFFRLGSPVALHAERKLNRLLVKDQGYLLGIDLQTQGKPLENFPIVPEGPAWGFEGTPLVSDGQLYVMIALREGTHAHSYVACYDLGATPVAGTNDPAGRATGKPRWRTKLGSSDSLGSGEIDELSCNLLSLREDTLFANTNRGLIAAIDRTTGEARWITRYPRAPFDAADQEDDDETFLRDLNPCLLYRDLCIVAPADCRQVFALHAATGRVMWTLPSGVAADAVHVLGVTGDYLILSGEFLYYVDVWTGRLVTQFSAPLITGVPKQPPTPRGYGRGAITSNHIYWPTRDQLFIFENRAEPRRPQWEPKLAKVIDLTPRGLTGGNLVFAGELLLIAAADQLFAVGIE